MGFGELLGFGAKVTVEYKADTKDMRSKLKELSGDEKKFAEEQLKNAEARNKALDGQKKGFEMLAVGIAASAAAVALAAKGIDAYAKTSEAAGEQVKKMKDGMSAAFDAVAVSVGRTVMAFEPLISGIASVIQLLGDLHIVGPVAVAALGYAISGNPKVAALLGAISLAMEATNALGVSASDAVDDELKKAGYTKNKAGDIVRIGSASVARPAAVDLSLFGEDDTGVSGDTLRRISARVDNLIGKAVSASLGVDKWSGALKFKTLKNDGGVTTTLPTRLGAAISPLGTNGDVGFGQVNQNLDAQKLGVANGGTLDALKKSLADMRDGVSRSMEKYNRGESESKLASIFGPLDEISGYRMAFDALSGSVSAAMTAWIDGSMSAGKAFKAFVGEAVKGIAIQMAMEALKHGAYAIGHLAGGDLRAAALHGTAAAKFAAGAVVAATAAKSLGSSGSTPTGSPGAPSLGGGGGAQPHAGTTQVIAFGDSFADDSPRQRQLKAARTYAKIRGTSGVEYA